MNEPNIVYLATGISDEEKRFVDFQEDLDLSEVTWSETKTASGDAGPYVRLDWFLSEINRMAEERMLKTGKLEGAHYASMQSLAKSFLT